jgi:hypothetical protein
MQLRSVLGSDHRIAHPIEWYLEAIRARDPIGNVMGMEDSR